MSKRKPGFTREQHERIGLELYMMRERLTNLQCCMDRVCGPHSEEGRLVADAYKRIDTLRGRLEARLFKGFDLPQNKETADLYVYFPGPLDREVTSCVKNPLTYQEMDEQASNKE